MLRRIRSSFLFLVLLALSSCDFSPRLHQDIIKAQRSILFQRYQEAVDQFEKILALNPKPEIKITVYYQLGELYSIQLQKPDKAIEYYQRICEETNDPLFLVKAREKMAEINFSTKKNYLDSIHYYSELLKFVPKLDKYDYYQFQVALSYFNLKKNQEASKVFSDISKNKGHKFFARSFYYLGLIQFHQQKWEESLVFWREYLNYETRKDNLVQVKYLMANVYEMMEDSKKAYDLYYAILGEYPNTQVIQNRLNAIYNRKVARKR